MTLEEFKEGAVDEIVRRGHVLGSVNRAFVRFTSKEQERYTWHSFQGIRAKSRPAWHNWKQGESFAFELAAARVGQEIARVHFRGVVPVTDESFPRDTLTTLLCSPGSPLAPVNGSDKWRVLYHQAFQVNGPPGAFFEDLFNVLSPVISSVDDVLRNHALELEAIISNERRLFDSEMLAA